MNTGDLLAYVASEYLDDRTELLDGDPDSLWSDRTLVRYLNAAQERLARRAWLLVDIGHPKAGVITLVTGKTVYTWHQSVLVVLDATFDEDVVTLPRSTDADIRGALPPSPDFFDVNTVTARTPGNPLAIATDVGTRLLRVTPAPAADQAGLKLYLRVARLPICPLEHDKPKGEPEIDSQWHLDMCHYAAGMALQKPTADSSQKTQGKALVDDFERVVREARQERERAWASPSRPEYCSSTAHI